MRNLDLRAAKLKLLENELILLLAQAEELDLEVVASLLMMALRAIPTDREPPAEMTG